MCTLMRTLRLQLGMPCCLAMFCRPMSSEALCSFKPRKAAVLTKMTRYEFEKKRFKDKTEEELRHYLESKRSDYSGLLEIHKHHHMCADIITDNLRKNGIETKVVDRFKLNNDLINWADVLFTVGGDGTYLLAASKVRDQTKPLIGVNSDPKRSEGRLCLPKEYDAVHFASAIKRLLEGNFRWKWRQRIRVTMSGLHDNDEPIELHDQQLNYLEHRYTEHVNENETFRRYANISQNASCERVLPVLALNEVFIGESLSSRYGRDSVRMVIGPYMTELPQELISRMLLVSYYEIKVDDFPTQKQKSSGVTVCTGTGSTSWFFHINHIPQVAVKEILQIVNQEVNLNINTEDKNLVKKIGSRFNESLIFSPSEPRMAYTVRDPVKNAVFNVPVPRGFANKIQICSRMWDACLVIDGGSSFKFNDGAVATFEIHDEDALRTVIFD